MNPTIHSVEDSLEATKYLRSTHTNSEYGSTMAQQQRSRPGRFDAREPLHMTQRHEGAPRYRKQAPLPQPFVTIIPKSKGNRRAVLIVREDNLQILKQMTSESYFNDEIPIEIAWTKQYAKQLLEKYYWNGNVIIPLSKQDDMVLLQLADDSHTKRSDQLITASDDTKASAQDSTKNLESRKWRLRQLMAKQGILDKLLKTEKYKLYVSTLEKVGKEYAIATGLLFTKLPTELQVMVGDYVVVNGGPIPRRRT